jgi:hypothetical protein
MKKILIAVFLVFLTLPAFGDYGLRQWRFDIVDADLGDIVADANFTVTVYESGEASAGTIYSDEYATAKTNPITPASDSSAAVGKLKFYTAYTTVDIQIASSVYAGTVKITGLTITDHRLVYPLGESVGNVSAGTISATGATTLNGNVTLGDAAADVVTVTGTIAGASPLVLEGTTANDYETTFAIADPSADRTFTFPNTTGGVMTTALTTNAADIANSVWGISNGFSFEGATANDHETTIAPTDPTADRTLTLPDTSGTFVLSTLSTNGQDAANSMWGISNGASFEGATADGNETTFTFTDPTADRTVTFPDAGGTVMYSSLATNGADAANAVTGASNAIVFEGATADGNETSLTPTDPTADRTITLPDASGTMMVEVSGVFTAAANAGTLSNATDNAWILGENSEDLKFTFSENACVTSSTTGVTSLDFGTIDVRTDVVDTDAVTSTNAYIPVATNSKDHAYCYIPISYVGATQCRVGAPGSDNVCVGLTAGADEIGSTEGYAEVDDANDFLRFTIQLPDTFVDTGTAADLILAFDVNEAAAEDCNIDVRIFEYGNTTPIITDTIIIADGAGRGFVGLTTLSTGIGADADISGDDSLLVELTCNADTDDFLIYGARLTYRVGIQSTQ